jgi:hypothetical protein
MTPERKSVLDSLGAAVAKKRLVFQQLGMQNVNGLDEVEKARASVQYAQARAELWNAEAALRAEIERTLR